MLSSNNCCVSHSAIPVAARTSPLSQVQVKEILELIRQKYPEIDFVPHYVSTTGDKDQRTSLRTMGKTDFFTKEVDELVLRGLCRISVHSAKDLPAVIPDGLQVICLTQSIDSSDSLVMKQGMKWTDLPSDALIATSSIRREEMVKELIPNARFIDLRGTIHQRLIKLDSDEAHGVVIAEAALIRLGLLHLNRVKLPGNGVEGQGQLAVIARDDDREMLDLFACLDVRL